MMRGAKVIVETCAQVQPGETVLIVSDSDMVSIAQTLAAAVVHRGAEPVVSIITRRERDGQEPPRPVAEALRNCDVFLTPVSRSITHTRAVRDAVQNGARGLVLTQFSEDMLISGGVEADFPAIAPLCRRIASIFQEGRELVLTTPAGTNLRMDITGRRGNAMTGIVGPGEFSPVPTIEANVSPVEGTAEGVIVVDGSIPYEGIGLIDEPIRVEVQGGQMVRIEGGRQAMRLRSLYESFGDPNVYNIAEIGVGLNPKSKMIGLMLEDEAVFGTVHVGTGTNITLGGNVKAACHYDLIVLRPSVTVDGRPVLIDGDVAPELKEGLSL